MFGLENRKALEQRITALELRMEALELRDGEHRLQLGELIDKVSYRLVERRRGRGRTAASQEELDADVEPESDHALGYRRRFSRSEGE